MNKNTDATDIPQQLIDECERLSLENNTTYFIFNKDESNIINLKLRPGKETERDIKLDKIVGDKFHIGTIDDFYDMPSRLSFYDTETKLIGRYARYEFVKDFFMKLGFHSSEIINFGPEFDQSFILSFNDDDFPKLEYDAYGLTQTNFNSWLLRIKPNLFLSIKYYTSDGEITEIFNGFFNINGILQSLVKSNDLIKPIVRNLKLSNILEDQSKSESKSSNISL